MTTTPAAASSSSRPLSLAGHASSPSGVPARNSSLPELGTYDGSAGGGGYSHLVGDLICIVCTYLDTRELLDLRAVHPHWSRFSRLSRSWASSSWCRRDPHGDPLSLLTSLALSAPHLRSLILPFRAPQWTSQLSAQCAPALTQLAALEHIVFRLYPLELPSSLINLRHIEVQEIDPDEDGSIELSPCGFDAIMQRRGLLSFRAVGRTCSRTMLERSSQSVSAADSLIILHLPRHDLNPITSAVMKRFRVLEELNLDTLFDVYDDVSSCTAARRCAPWGGDGNSGDGGGGLTVQLVRPVCCVCRASRSMVCVL
jgi:hypothetical protein